MAGALLVGLSGCVQSALNADDAVVLVGAAVREDATPLPGAEVLLDRSINSACGGTERYRSLKSDGAGAFALDLSGAETRYGDIARCFRLSLPSGTGSSRVSAEFLMQVTEVRVPALQLWTGSLAVRPTKGGWELAFRELATTHGTSSSLNQLVVQGETGVVWRAALAKGPLGLSELMLEDFQGMSAQASTGAQVKGSGTTFGFSYQSDRVQVPSGARVPVSRGASCSVASGKCPLTDGRLTPVDLGSATEVRVALGAPRVLRWAVVRGLGLGSAAKELVLEGSADGSHWAALAELDAAGGVAPYRVLELSGAGAVSEIRLRGSQPDGQPVRLSSLDELSLFD